VGKAETATLNGILPFPPFCKGGLGGFRGRSVAAGRVKSPPTPLCKKGGVKAAFLVALLLALPAHAELPPAVAQALVQAGIPDTHVGILVRDIDNPEPLLAHGENRSLNPASVMKVVTTLAALDMLGPAHGFKTRVWVEGDIKDGVLTGNLILQGGGDPGLTQERFWLLLREIRARGIGEIHGDVILDNSFHELESVDPAAFDQAPLRPYNAPPAALLANFNTLNLRLGAMQDSVQARIEADDALPLDNRLEATDAPCNGWREQLGVSDGRRPAGPGGTLPQGVRRTGPSPQPVVPGGHRGRAVPHPVEGGRRPPAHGSYPTLRARPGCPPAAGVRFPAPVLPGPGHQQAQQQRHGQDAVPQSRRRPIRRSPPPGTRASGRCGRG
jgi:hypothetical protein